LERIGEHRPELILLDLMMPEMDGFQFVTQLRENPLWRSIPVVVITALELTEQERLYLQGQVKQILQKGAYSGEELLHEVSDLVATCIRPKRAGLK
jgi:CheY-like chemotaxis protein